MIIWRGKGLLVFLSLILGVSITTLTFNFLGIDLLDNSSKSLFIMKGIITTILTALINDGFTKKYISEKIRFFIDEESGERVQVKDSSHLFFIPNKYWTWIILVLGFIMTIESSLAY